MTRRPLGLSDLLRIVTRQPQQPDPWRFLRASYHEARALERMADAIGHPFSCLCGRCPKRFSP